MILARVRLSLTLLTALLSLPITHVARAAEAPPRGIGRTVAAAEAFLATIDPAARSKGVFAFDDAVQKQRWSNLPSGIYQRVGFRLADLTKAQRDAALQLLEAVLSPSGYQKVVGIMEGDEQLKGGGPGGRVLFGRDEYFLAFLGTPSATRPWRIQFGGHHLALNITLAGDQGTLTPSHTASQPAKFTLEGKTIRPLGGETDRAFALMEALTPAQQKQAILGSKFRDLVLGPGQDGKSIAPEGVRVSSFTAAQRELLLALAREWVGILPDASAEPKMAEIKSGLEETWFAWSGPTAPGSAAYFRIQGPTVFIEYAPQTLGGDATQHIHTMYRDPSNEYGAKWLKP